MPILFSRPVAPPWGGGSFSRLSRPAVGWSIWRKVARLVWFSHYCNAGSPLDYKFFKYPTKHPTLVILTNYCLMLNAYCLLLTVRESICSADSDGGYCHHCYSNHQQSVRKASVLTCNPGREINTISIYNIQTRSSALVVDDGVRGWWHDVLWDGLLDRLVE